VSAETHENGSLAHHFDSYDQQRESASLGMWIFLATEVLFFGGLFTAYTLYRWQYREAFLQASHHLDIKLGTINTGVLIMSSLTMALAVRAAQMGRSKSIVRFLVLTILLGSVFLGIKGAEYHHKYVDHLIPGPGFQFEGPEIQHAQLFYFLYFGMTGLHGLHMVVGIGLLAWLIRPSWRGRFTPDNHNWVEGVGLYWHFVDIVWIFLFPLLYLIGRHSH
jgi:cytochrome c oxidase subunit 3